MGPPNPLTRTAPTLLLGPTGTGKTLLARTAANLLGLPWVYENLCDQTEAGFVGRSIADIVLSAIQATGGNIPRAEAGSVVLCDELDKVRKKPSVTGADVSGVGVQRGLLALADASSVPVLVPDGRRGRTVTVRTSGMWLIFAGSFADGLAGLIAQRVRGQRRRIGFGDDATQRERRLREGELLAHVTEEDLIAFGMLPELVGRIPEIIVLNDLGPEQLRRILTDAVDGPLRRAEMLAARENVEIRWTPRLLDRIAAEAYASGLGARSLSPAIARVTRRLMYELPDVVRKRGSSAMLLVELDEPALEDDGRYRIVRRRKEV
jgi:ATP-dependent Clp protease ATP-binding subunit ClpX